jgi:hypothetical protein
MKDLQEGRQEVNVEGLLISSLTESIVFCNRAQVEREGTTIGAGPLEGRKHPVSIVIR